ATILSLLLAWGRNFYGFNVFLFEHLPLYNKFRTPEMALIMANLTMVILAVLALKEIFDHEKLREKFIKPIIISAGITSGVCLFFALFGGALFNFSTPSDANFPDWLVSALVADRKAMLTGDSWRSFFLIAIASILLIIYLKKSFKTNYLIFALGFLIFIDLWTVDKRFLGEDKFVSKRQAKEFVQSDIDKMILQDTSHYRVLNLASNTFNESATSAFHKSVGGYSPAKLRRYQDIIDYYFSKQINQNIINMLNAKYIIFKTQKGNRVQINNDIFGNAWFTDSLKWVNSPDEEILEIGNVDLKNIAVIDTVWRKSIVTSSQSCNNMEANDTANSIKLTSYENPGYLIYESISDTEKFAVFSEVYYKTWKAYIDGKEAPMVRANYILRGLKIPAGKHVIELKCKDELMIKSAQISLIFSIIVGVMLSGLIVCKKIKK
ncbi:MAG: hypothetical protein LBB53_06525, partial [Prevotellaceae bacterium]|nr:hypothetical protein [Prevotellaceae bacterium]